MIFHVSSNSSIRSLINSEKSDIDETVENLEILLENHIVIYYSVKVKAYDSCVQSIGVQIKDIFTEREYYFKTIDTISKNKKKFIVSLSEVIPEIESLFDEFLKNFTTYQELQIFHYNYGLRNYNIDLGDIPQVPLSRNQTVKVNYNINPQNRFSGTIEFDNQIDGKTAFKVFVEYYKLDERCPTVIAHCDSVDANTVRRFLSDVLCNDNFSRQFFFPGRFNLGNLRLDNRYPVRIGRQKYSRVVNSNFFEN